MITNRSITCTNKDGDSLTFTENGFTPFLLVGADNVYESRNKITVAENTVMDGAVYQSSIAKYRNIVITLRDMSAFRTVNRETDDIYISSGKIHGKTLEIYDTVTDSNTGTKDYVDHRSLLDKVFKRGEPGQLIFREDEEERAIDYYVEYIKSTGKNSSRLHTISLICPDPFFYDPNDINVYLSQLISDFEFIHEFPEDGEEFGHNMGVYENIYNESANENIGLTIAISGTTDVINPVLTRMESSEFIQIGDTLSPFTLSVGDTLLITTGTGHKHVYLIHNGTTTEINYRMADGSSFIQLMRGNNNISFNAASGKNSMMIRITYRMQYARA